MDVTINGDNGLYRIFDSEPQTNGQTCIEWSAEKAKTDSVRFIALTSKRDPMREAKRLLGNFVLKDNYVAVVMGASSLALIKILKEQMFHCEQKNLLLVEADATFAKNLFSLFPELFADIALVTPHNMNDIEQFLDYISVEHLLGYKIFSPPAIIKTKKDFYLQAEYQIKQGFSSRLSDLFTRIEFEPLWIKNSFSQTALFYKAKPVHSLFSICSNNSVPAVLISSGPSLRAALPWLKKNQDKVFIACVDSAYRILHRTKITPHLIMSLDSQVFTRRHFGGLPQGEKNVFPFLYADLVANPQVTSRWQGTLFLGMSAAYDEHNKRRQVTPGCDFLEDFFSWQKGKIPGDVQSGGSVSTALFDLLRNMGFAQIYLLGQDSGFTWREFHCMGTHHSDAWLPQTNRFKNLENINDALIRRRHTSNMLSIQKKTIKADYVMSLYRSWFENAAELLSLKLFNAAADGVPLEGVPHVSVEDIPLKKEELQKLLHKMKTLAAQNDDSSLFSSTKVLAQDEQIKNFVSLIEQTDATQEKIFPFLKYIGRKHLIKAARLQEQQEQQEQQEKLENLAFQEKQKFCIDLRAATLVWKKYFFIQEQK